MRMFKVLLLLLLPFSLKGQLIADCIEVKENNILKFYFKSHGILVNQECADYYRIAKMNLEAYVFDGLSTDYFISGEPAVIAYYNNNILNGDFESYYLNGQLKEKGEYLNGLKTGKWTTWFDNGQLKKIIKFSTNDFFISELYRRNGKQLIINGKGKFFEKDLKYNTIIRGKVKNGKQDGKWSLYDYVYNSETARDTFIEGKFIKGQNIARIQPFNGNYYDKPECIIDLTTDLLNLSYSSKINCLIYNKSYLRQHTKYNSNYGYLPFFDFIYMNFNPSEINKGYILVGFTVNQNGVIEKINTHSTINNKLVEDDLIKIFSTSKKWDPETLNNSPIETKELFAFQFFNGKYKILNDSRNIYPPSIVTLDKEAQYKFGNDSLISLVNSTFKIPLDYRTQKLDLAVCFEYHIDPNGNVIDDNGVFINRKHVSDIERTLYYSLSNTIMATGIWQPATSYDLTVNHYFIAVLNIIKGEPKLRLFSKNWLLE